MTKKHNLILAPLIALGAAVGVFCLYIGGIYIYSTVTQAYSHIKTTPMTQDQSIINTDNADAVQDGSTITFPELSKQPPAQPVRLIISTAPIFDAAKAKGSLNIINHPDNKGLLLQVRIVERNNPDNIYYISPVLKPEQKIETDNLINQDLQAGNYDALAIFDFYTQSDESHYYSVASAITLRIRH